MSEPYDPFNHSIRDFWSLHSSVRAFWSIHSFTHLTFNPFPHSVRAFWSIHLFREFRSSFNGSEGSNWMRGGSEIEWWTVQKALTEEWRDQKSLIETVNGSEGSDWRVNKEMDQKSNEWALWSIQSEISDPFTLQSEPSDPFTHSLIWLLIRSLIQSEPSDPFTN